MRRILRILLPVLLLLCLAAGAAFFLLPHDGQPEPRVITPVAYPPTLNPTPIPVPTAEPGVRVIPLPVRIITVEVIREFLVVDNPATLKIVNKWSSPFTVDFQGVLIVVAPGQSETREIPPGEYFYTAMSADCQQARPESITLEANTLHTLELFCSTRGVSIQAPGADWATLAVDNQTGRVITFSVDGRSFQVPPGLMEIPIPPGSYTYTADIPGVLPPPPEQVTLAAGESYKVTISITTQ
jgi:hypothetical protein